MLEKPIIRYYKYPFQPFVIIRYLLLNRLAMKNLQILSLISLFCIVALQSCNDFTARDEIVCTEEFRYITIKVSGEPLTEYYTVRLSDSDTIRPNPADAVFDKTYIVLSDNYQQKLENKKDTFQFIGKREGGMVREDFVISADHCHINKISGKSEI